MLIIYAILHPCEQMSHSLLGGTCIGKCCTKLIWLFLTLKNVRSIYLALVQVGLLDTWNLAFTVFYFLRVFYFLKFSTFLIEKLHLYYCCFTCVHNSY